ncbi:MAG TPA: hypothetical protein VMH90_07160 [Thermoplasmata archaeon]|nr:hypothetical protein [Thermoplasmata archaeon]
MESEIRRGAVRLGLVETEASLRLEVASRTDRGVHARANALVLDAAVPGHALLGALNGIAPDLWFDRAAQVPTDFRVRSARRRMYRYFEPDPVGRRRDWAAAAALFHGSIDVRSFGRGLPMDRPCLRDLEAIRLHWEAGFLVLDVRGRSFVWGMVRKIVGALRAHAAGTLPLPEIQAALQGELRLSLPMAEPESLVLWEVQHGIRWTVPYTGRPRARMRRCTAEVRAARARVRVLEALGAEGEERSRAGRATPPGFL